MKPSPIVPTSNVEKCMTIELVYSKGFINYHINKPLVLTLYRCRKNELEKLYTKSACKQLLSNIELLSLSYGKHTRLSSQNGKTETTITACIVLTLFLCFGQI